ncbi:hypothetical protein V3C99_010130 [Haemonchus contortus]
MYREPYYASPVAHYDPYYDYPSGYPHPYYPPSPYYPSPYICQLPMYEANNRNGFMDSFLGACLGCCAANLLCCCLTPNYGDCYC